VKYLVKSNTIETNAHKNFYIGLITLILDFKISRFEKDESRVQEARTILNGCYSHLNLMKELSTLLYFEFSFLRAYDDLSRNGLDSVVLEELVNSFKYYKSYRHFRKR